MTERPLAIGITCYPTAGGSGIVATELGKELARRGHTVHFITHAVPVRLREFEERIAFHPVEAENYPLFNHQPYALNLAAKMSEVIERESLDIMHVHYALPHAVSAYLAREIVRPRAVKVVTTLHGTDITLVGLQPSFFSVTKFSIEQSDGVTAVSGWLRDQTRSIFGVTTPIEVIHNFVDPERFRPAADARRRRCYAEPEELVFMHASNFRAVKNAHRVVEVFHAVADQVPARLLMVGEGPDVAPARELARELGIAARVAFLGEQEYIEALLPLADVFLLPSSHESFGLVALEAMSSGVPVIATRVGGMPEVIEDGVSGFLRDPGDVAAMTEVALELARNPGLRRQVSHAARARAAGHFAQGRAVEFYESYYRRLLAGAGERTMKATMRPVGSPERAEK
jgi:N-acetyl-alpha-D-glucosaminyl L-malate synthase BshA